MKITSLAVELVRAAFLIFAAVFVFAIGYLPNSYALPSQYFILQDHASCFDLGATPTGNFCVLEVPLAINSGETLEIRSPMTLFAVKTITVHNGATIKNFGGINNRQSTTNDGIIDNFNVISSEKPFLNSGTINNSGTISNSNTIDNTGTINNFNIIDNSNTINNFNIINNVCVGIINDPNNDPTTQPGVISGNQPIHINCAPDLTITDATNLEGDTGMAFFDFTISLTTPAPAGGVQVTFSTSDDTATTSDSDYQLNSGMVTIPEGQTSQILSIQVNGDTKFEPGEAFTVNLSNPVNAVITDEQGIGTIQNDDPMPSISISDANVLEGDSGTTNADFIVTLSNPSQQTITVNFVTQDGTATVGNDYNANSGTLTFAPSETTKTLPVLVNGENLNEADETFLVNLSNPTNAVIGDGQGIGTITNNDAAPNISINDVSVIESDVEQVTTTFAVTLSAPSQNTITVDYTTADGLATTGSDYVSDFGTLTFAPGQTTKDIMISINGDLTHELDEDFFVNLSNPTNAAISDSQGIATIMDNDGMPIITINDAQVTEGDTSTTNIDFTVNLSNPSQSPITVDFTTTDNNAVAGSDYMAESGQLTFAPGQITENIAIIVNGDQINEADETFTVNLSNAQNAMTSDDVGVATIINDDPIPSISINDVSITEGNSGTTDIQFTASLNNPSGQTVMVDYTTAEGTAIPTNDYSTATGVLTFTPGETTQTITVSVNGDGLNEPDEIFTVNLSNPINVVISDGQGVGTITNDDPVPTLGINNVSVTELDSVSVNAVFTVSLSGASGQTVTANFGTTDGTAQSNSDYMATAGTVIFNPGEISQSITVVVNDDVLTENSETFFVTLSSETNAIVSGTGGQGTILDNDPLPTISINDVSVAEPDSGTTNAVFTVSLSNPSQSPITVDFTTADGTAVAGLDYVANSATITFAPEETQKDITIAVNNDLLNEADETFSVSLSGPTNAVLGDGQGVVTIINNPIPTISVNDVEIIGEAGNVVVVFEVSDSTSDVVTVEATFGTDGDSATIDLDYMANPITVTFGPGETTKTVDITIIDDNVDESDEIFTVTLSNPTNAIIGDGQAIVTIIDDDQTPTISINDISINEGNAGTTNAEFTASLSNPSSQTIMVNFATGDGTASLLDDYVSDSGSIIFAPGETTKNISITVNGDGFNEANETFFVNLTDAANEIVNLSNPTNVVIGDGQALGTITNDDPLPSISITDVSIAEGNLVATTADLMVSLNTPSFNSVTVDFATADGTAISPDDYSGGAGVITFNPGETTKIISVTINPDILDENDETFFVNISNPTNAAISDNQGIITILDDDQSSAELFCGLPIEEYDTVIDGTLGNDKLVGTNGDDLIRGYAGDDKIRGKKGNDCLIGGDGMDKIWGGDGKDAIQGGNQDDILNGGKGDDKISGEAGNDRINGGKDNDIINGNLGADRIHGNQGNDVLFGDEGDDRIHGGLGNDAIDGGANIDKCKGGQGNNTITNCEDQENEMKEDEDEDPEETN